MAFEVIKDKDDASLFKASVSTFTASAGSLIERLAGAALWTACSAASDHFTPKAILMEGATAASSVLAYRLSGMETVKADSTNNSAAADNGDRMLLTDASVVNNTGTDDTSENVLFIQETTSGATSAKKLIGRILVGNGVDPDAA